LTHASFRAAFAATTDAALQAALGDVGEVVPEVVADVGGCGSLLRLVPVPSQ
jgi:hypothetical protein